MHGANQVLTSAPLLQIMKFVIVLAAVVAAASAARLSDADIQPQWQEFKVGLPPRKPGIESH